MTNTDPAIQDGLSAEGLRNHLTTTLKGPRTPATVLERRRLLNATHDAVARADEYPVLFPAVAAILRDETASEDTTADVLFGIDHASTAIARAAGKTLSAVEVGVVARYATDDEWTRAMLEPLAEVLQVTPSAHPAPQSYDGRTNSGGDIHTAASDLLDAVIATATSRPKRALAETLADCRDATAGRIADTTADELHRGDVETLATLVAETDGLPGDPDQLDEAIGTLTDAASPTIQAWGEFAALFAPTPGDRHTDHKSSGAYVTSLRAALHADAGTRTVTADTTVDLLARVATATSTPRVRRQSVGALVDIVTGELHDDALILGPGPGVETDAVWALQRVAAAGAIPETQVGDVVSVVMDGLGDNGSIRRGAVQLLRALAHADVELDAHIDGAIGDLADDIRSDDDQRRVRAIRKTERLVRLDHWSARERDPDIGDLDSEAVAYELVGALVASLHATVGDREARSQSMTALQSVADSTLLPDRAVVALADRFLQEVDTSVERRRIAGATGLTALSRRRLLGTRHATRFVDSLNVMAIADTPALATALKATCRTRTDDPDIDPHRLLDALDAALPVTDRSEFDTYASLVRTIVDNTTLLDPRMAFRALWLLAAPADEADAAENPFIHDDLYVIPGVVERIARIISLPDSLDALEPFVAHLSSTDPAVSDAMARVLVDLLKGNRVCRPHVDRLLGPVLDALDEHRPDGRSATVEVLVALLSAEGATDAHHEQAAGIVVGLAEEAPGMAATVIANTPVKHHLTDGAKSKIAVTFGKTLALEPTRVGYSQPTAGSVALGALAELVSLGALSATELADVLPIAELDPEAAVSLEVYLEGGFRFSARGLLELVARAARKNPVPFAPLVVPLRSVLAGNELKEDMRCRAIGLLPILNTRPTTEIPELDT